MAEDKKKKKTLGQQETEALEAAEGLTGTAKFEAKKRASQIKGGAKIDPDIPQTIFDAEGRPSGVILPGGQTMMGKPSEIQAEKAARAPFAAELGAQRQQQRIGELQEQLAPEAERIGEKGVEQQVLAIQKPPLTDEEAGAVPLLEKTAEIGLKIPTALTPGTVPTANTLFFEKALGVKLSAPDTEKMAKTPFGKALGNTLLALGAAATLAGGKALLAYAAAKVSATAVVASTTSATSASAKIGLGAGGLIAGGIIGGFGYKAINAVTGIPKENIEGEIQILNKEVEGGERLIGTVRAGGSVVLAEYKLDTMVQEIDVAEQKIKEMGLYDVKFEISGDETTYRKFLSESRQAMGRRYEELEAILRQGTATYDPEQLLLNAAADYADVEYFENLVK